MDHLPAAFPVTQRSKVKRVHERGSHQHAEVYAILDAAMLCHVSYVIEGQPFCTPTLHWREGDVLYWHGSSASRMLKHLRQGMPACLTVSHLDGLVMARSAFNHSANYRSVMCFGTAQLIEDRDEKLAAAKAMVERYFPDRYPQLRPIHAQELKATTFISMKIDEASAKVRAAGVGDDEADYGHPVWAGVIPVRTVLGEDETCPRLELGISRPANLAPYAEGRRLDEALLDTQQLYEGLPAEA